MTNDFQMKFTFVLTDAYLMENMRAKLDLRVIPIIQCCYRLLTHNFFFISVDSRRYNVFTRYRHSFFLNIHPIFRPNFSYNSDIYIYMIIKKKGKEGRLKLKLQKKRKG